MTSPSCGCLCGIVCSAESIEAAKISLIVTVERIAATEKDRYVVIRLARASGQEALGRRRTVVLCSLRKGWITGLLLMSKSLLIVLR